MKKCDYFVDNGECYYGNSNNTTGKQTESKLTILNNYVLEWIIVTMAAKGKDRYGRELIYDGLVFVDCMSSAGMYKTHDGRVIDGTSINVLKHFINSKKYHPDKTFKLVLNDKDEKSMKCQECRINDILSNSKNVDVIYEKMDVSMFLDKLSESEFFDKIWNKDKKFHTVFFYDPYDVDIRWDAISKLLNKLKRTELRYDFILTHFFQNDTIRSIMSGTKKIGKYESAYGMMYDDLADKIKSIDSFERNQFLRDALIKMMIKNLRIDQTKIAYGPVFSQTNSAIYDIVFYSKSLKGLKIFKEFMYKTNTRDKDNNNLKHAQIVMSFDDQDIIDDASYEQKRYTGSEREYFYSVSSYADIIVAAFIRRENVSKEDILGYRNIHPFIPTSSIEKALDSELRLRNVSINKKVYDFSKIDRIQK
ncbi:MAG: three-Cys-motif partner protein TcmP [Acholeplasmataceae bacterium]|jgi:three-Cys-motif partner protein|nr:three-Cys-motif partner protein TcmP [Acholeplasmataceae bacterium]